MKRYRTTIAYALGLAAVLLIGTAFASVAGAVVGAISVAVGLLLLAALLIWEIASVERFAFQPQINRAATNRELVHTLAERETARQTQLTQLQSQVTAMRDSMDVLPEAIVVLDSSHRILWSNHRADALLGVPRGAHARDPLSSYMREPELMRALQGQFEEPVRLNAPRDPTRTLEFRGFRFSEDHWLLVATDISERHRVETMRRDFIANLSHELKTPLTVLAGFVETMQDHPDLPPPQITDALAHMRTQSDSMQKLVQDLLSLSRLESSDAPAARVPFPSRNAIDAALKAAQALSAGAHTFALTLLPDHMLIGAEDDVTSALTNLLTNAVRYTTNGGEIALEEAIDNAQSLRISVRDSGIGIAAEHISRLTERFYRVDRGRSRSSGGTGLGLAIVKHVMQRHGGRLDVESTPGVGSTFTLVFPADRVRVR